MRLRDFIEVVWACMSERLTPQCPASCGVDASSQQMRKYGCGDCFYNPNLPDKKRKIN